MANKQPTPIPLAYARPQPKAARRSMAIGCFWLGLWAMGSLAVIVDHYWDPMRDEVGIPLSMMVVPLAATLCSLGFLPVILSFKAVAKQFQRRLCGIAGLCGVASMLVCMGLGSLLAWQNWDMGPAMAIVAGPVISGIISLVCLRIAWRLGWLQPSEPAGSCPTCGHNLTGNTSGICPECETPVPAREPTA